MRKRLVIWCGFEDYELYRSQLRMEEIKGNIEIAAVIFLDEDVVKIVDGITVIKVEQLQHISYDYIVGFGDALSEDMIGILQMLKISREQFLPGRIFNLPEFDFKRYLSVKEERVTIISDNCWGGMTYHALGMEFYSPFINLYVEKNDVIKLMQHLPDYINKPLEYVAQSYDKNRQAEYPVCKLGDVILYFNHYNSYDEAKVVWNRRKEKINWNNIFVKMLLEDQEQLEGFRKISYRKIGFSKFSCEDRDVIDLSNVVKSDYFCEKYQGRFWELVNWQARSERVDLKHYDILKLLLGEEDYRRTVL